MNQSLSFVKALKNKDFKAIQSIPKSDLHSHSVLASRLGNLILWCGKNLPSPPEKMKSIAEMDNYIRKNIIPEVCNFKGFEYALKAAFLQANDDRISVLEMSTDIWFLDLFDNADNFTSFISKIHNAIAPHIIYIPQIGINRESDPKKIFPKIEECLETGFFRSIDLYGNELACGPEKFQLIFKKAKSKGLRLKAHTGEFGSAESIRQTVEILDLDEVQHGINAVNSPEVMSWLQDNKIQLNVCPTSNVKLSVVKNISVHPIKILYDSGIPVTINTDDIMIFGQSVSDEYLNLYKNEILSAEILNNIRLQGLKQREFYE